MINDLENFVGGPSCAREGLDVRRCLTEAESSNQDSKENLK